GAAQLVFGDIAADEPVAEREAEIDGAAGLGDEFRVHAPDGEDEVLEGQAGGLRRGLPGPAHEGNSLRAGRASTRPARNTACGPMPGLSQGTRARSILPGGTRDLPDRWARGIPRGEPVTPSRTVGSIIPGPPLGKAPTPVGVIEREGAPGLARQMGRSTWGSPRR